MRAMHINEIEGALVTFPFFMAGKYVRPGTWIDHATLARMPISNRNAFQDKGYLYVIPKAAAKVLATAKAAIEAPERHVVSHGPGWFNVIEGNVLNSKPLRKEAAYELAGLPLPDKTTQ